jgi:hypothetical protein
LIPALLAVLLGPPAWAVDVHAVDVHAVDVHAVDVYAVAVYVNGVLVNGLKDQVLQDVTVTFDANGDVRIEAPWVRIGRSSAPVVANSEPESPAAEPVSTDVPTGRWWLVATDAGSIGVQIDVRVNGDLVQVIESGDPQIVLDLAPFLRRGPNQISMTARALGEPGTQPLTVYLGSGSTQTGVLELGNPEITFAPDQEDVGAGVTRVYTVTID